MKEKHFLDTSVIRPILTSPPKVKNYYIKKLKGDKYICDYIKMEFFRGYIKSSIDFYFLLAMPQYSNFSEVLYVWSHKFQIREHKNIEIMIANLLEFNGYLDNKEKGLRKLADYIRRLIGKLNQSFKSIGNDSTYCKKGKLKLNFKPHSIKESFLDFFNLIKDNEQYKACKIKEFIYNKQKDNIKILIEHGEKISGLGDKEGFNKLTKNLNQLNGKEITCSHCSKLGDAVISILSNNDMTLEHTDYSFNYLCKILNKKHNLHPYDKAIMDAE
jgi:hypothetical protein